jgi:hypothetical protein
MSLWQKCTIVLLGVVILSNFDGRPRAKPFIKDLADNPEFLMLVPH